MYAPTLDLTSASHGTDMDTEFLLIIDQFDSWSIGDVSAVAGPSALCMCYQPDPELEEKL